MSEPVITVENLAKAYRISHRLQRNAHPTIKDELSRLARKPLELIGAHHGVNREDFWALQDINFEVAPGDVVGIMGRNGSGKSTLFKIISRITQPSKGEVTLRGRVASLLEVGTGFHPELTGRENVYFNGSILGMSKKEIDRKFDDIVAFSEVERFLDTPTKFYSSGMKVRLAFSVAAHLESEILLIDEVLAVGDVRFKQKSIERMKKVATDGRTILFVSHIVHQIEQICNRGIVLNDGKLVFDGGLQDGIDTYLDLNQLGEEARRDARADDSIVSHNQVGGDELNARITKVETTLGKNGLPQLTATVVIDNLSGHDHKDLWLGLVITDKLGKNVSLLSSDLLGRKLELKASQSSLELQLSIDDLLLVPDKYTFTIGMRSAIDPTHVYLRREQEAQFEIPSYDFLKTDFQQIKREQRPPVLYKFDLK